jgi:NADPH:quinone reductase-like Zn-dependent oxidoreductase
VTVYVPPDPPEAIVFSGALRPVVDRIIPLEEAGEALHYLEANRNFGKVVLQVGEEP